MKYVCADIRPQSVTYGLADETGTLLETGFIEPEEKAPSLTAHIRSLARKVKEYEKTENLAGVALAVPAIIDPEAGVVLTGNAFPDGENLTVTDLMTAACGLPCTLENSVKCAALAEYWLGAGQRSHSLFCLSIGSTISGAAILNGRILHGASYSAGEIGFMKIGSSATFAEAASLSSLIRSVANARQVPVDSIDEKKLFRQAKSGDVVATMAVRRLIDHLAAGIANICYLFNPDMVIIGGSLVAQMRFVRPLLAPELKKRLRPLVYEHTRVTFARLGETASLTGALYHFLMMQKEKDHEA